MDEDMHFKIKKGTNNLILFGLVFGWFRSDGYFSRNWVLQLLAMKKLFNCPIYLFIANVFINRNMCNVDLVELWKIGSMKYFKIFVFLFVI